MCQALDETEPDRVAHRDEDERNRRSSGVDRERVRWRVRDDDLWAECEDLSHERGDFLGPALRVTILDLEILTHDIAALAQPLQPSLHHLGSLEVPEDSDA